MPRASTCRSCGAPILWRTHHRTGKLAPIDAEPSPFGNVALLPGERYAIATKDGPWHAGDTGERRTSHYATCPQASGWRGRSR